MADFNARLTTFEAGINSKIDSQVSSYLDRNGIWNGKSFVPENFILSKCDSDVWSYPDVDTRSQAWNSYYIDDSNGVVKSKYNYWPAAGVDDKSFSWLLHSSMPKSGLVFIKYSWAWTGQMNSGNESTWEHEATEWYKLNKEKSYEIHTRYSSSSYSAGNSGNGYIVWNNMPPGYKEPTQLNWYMKFKKGSEVLNARLLTTYDTTPLPNKTYNGLGWGMANLGEGHLNVGIDSFFVSKGDSILMQWHFLTGGRTNGGIRALRGNGKQEQTFWTGSNSDKALTWFRWYMDIEDALIY